MIKFHGHVDADVTPQRAFELLADMAQLARWNPNVTASSIATGTPLQEGATFRCTLKRGLFRMEARPTLVHVEPGRSVRYEGWIGPLWSVDSLGFEPHGSGVRVSFTNESRLPGWLRPFDRILNAAFQPQARKALAGAERYLAENAEGASRG